MSEAGYRDAWETYKEALAALHGAAVFEEIAEPTIALAPPEPEAALDVADRCVEASARAEEELEELLNAREPAIRGQAARRMSALAGVDLHTATELARRESRLETSAVAAEPSAPVAADALAELGGVLDEDLPPSGDSPGSSRAGEPVDDPSVISLNGIGASHAATTFFLSSVGLIAAEALRHRLFFPADGTTFAMEPTKRPGCLFCSNNSRSVFARGDGATLPCRTSSQSRPQLSAGRQLRLRRWFAGRWLRTFKVRMGRR
jgi:hypothetical protein